jgi:hypothetical protein
VLSLESRKLTATVAALSLAVLAALPAEHIHTRAADHHRDDAALIHRHFEAHHPPDRTATLEHQDDDHDVQWIASLFTGREKSVPSRPPGLVVAVLAALTPQLISAQFFISTAESAHDPPWASAPTLRGPPSFSA